MKHSKQYKLYEAIRDYILYDYEASYDKAIVSFNELHQEGKFKELVTLQNAIKIDRDLENKLRAAKWYTNKAHIKSLIELNLEPAVKIFNKYFPHLTGVYWLKDVSLMYDKVYDKIKESFIKENTIPRPTVTRTIIMGKLELMGDEAYKHELKDLVAKITEDGKY